SPWMVRRTRSSSRSSATGRTLQGRWTRGLGGADVVELSQRRDVLDGDRRGDLPNGYGRHAGGRVHGTTVRRDVGLRILGRDVLRGRLTRRRLIVRALVVLGRRRCSRPRHV